MGTFNCLFRPTWPKYQMLRVLGSPEDLPRTHTSLFGRHHSLQLPVANSLFRHTVLVSTDRASSTRLSWISKELLFKKSDWPRLFWLAKKFPLEQLCWWVRGGQQLSGVERWQNVEGVTPFHWHSWKHTVLLSASSSLGQQWESPSGLSRANGWKGRILFHKALSSPGHVLGNIPQPEYTSSLNYPLFLPQCYWLLLLNTLEHSSTWNCAETQLRDNSFGLMLASLFLLLLG